MQTLLFCGVFLQFFLRDLDCFLQLNVFFRVRKLIHAVIALGEFHNIFRCDALIMDRLAGGCKILGNCHLESRAFVTDRIDALDDSLSEALDAYYSRVCAIAQGTGQNLGGTGAVFVDQDRQLDIYLAVLCPGI